MGPPFCRLWDPRRVVTLRSGALVRSFCRVSGLEVTDDVPGGRCDCGPGVLRDRVQWLVGGGGLRAVAERAGVDRKTVHTAMSRRRRRPACAEMPGRMSCPMTWDGALAAAVRPARLGWSWREEGLSAARKSDITGCAKGRLDES